MNHSHAAVAIREMQLADIPDVRTLAADIWRRYYPSLLTPAQIEYMLEMMYSDASLAAQMTEKKHRFWLLHDRQTLLGYASASAESIGHFHIHKFYVDAGRHRQGLGAQLMAHIIGELQPVKLTLGVNRLNIPAINFYFRQGFCISHTQDTDIGNGFVMEDFIMKRGSGA